MIQIEHIVFDIGKVLIHYDPELPFKRLIPDNKKRAWFLAEVCTGEWNVEQDRGRSWQEAEAELIEQHPQEKDLIRAFRRHWYEMVPHAYDYSVEIMTNFINEGHDVTMLTNFATDTFLEARQIYPFLKLPRGVTVSGDVGLIKPDERIYHLHAETFGLTPAATLFIDDSENNVTGARNAGWNAVRFTNAESLQSDLRSFGLV